MARLVMFYRRIDISGDDLYAVAILTILTHIAWYYAYIIPRSLVYCLSLLAKDVCLRVSPVDEYVRTILRFAVLLIPLEILIMALSFCGTVSKPGPRRHLSALCHVHVLLTIMEFGAQLFGIYAITKNNAVCPVSSLVRGVVFASASGNLVWLLSIASFLLVSQSKTKMQMSRYYDTWKKRLEFLFCGYLRNWTNGHDVLSEVAQQLAEFFHGLDWAPSDFLVGLILLKREQKKIRELNLEKRRVEFLRGKTRRIRRESSFSNDSGSFYEQPRFDSTSSIQKPPLVALAPPIDDPKGPLDVMMKPVWSSVKNYRPFFPQSLYSNASFDSDFKIRKNSGRYFYGYEVMIRDDINDVLHFSQYAEIAYSRTACERVCGDCLYLFSDSNDIHKSPFFVARDDVWKCVIIGIRGTYSAADFLVDLQVELEPLNIPEIGDDVVHWTHKGILKTSKNIMGELREGNWIENLIRSPNSAAYGYDIVTTGHSLGAGAAALIAYMLRHEGYVSTRCFAYSPPGQMLTEEAAKYFEEFTVSIVTGDDIVCRLSRNSVEVLKMDIIRLLSECDEPKHRIVGSVLSNICCCFPEKGSRPNVYLVKQQGQNAPSYNLSSSSNFSALPLDTVHEGESSIDSESYDGASSAVSANALQEPEKRRLSWVLKPFSPFLRTEIQNRLTRMKDTLKALDPTVPGTPLEELNFQGSDDSSILPQPRTFLPGKILYIEKCRLWHDDKDIDLPWTHSRYSIITAMQPTYKKRNRLKSIFPMSSSNDLEANLQIPSSINHNHTASSFGVNARRGNGENPVPKKMRKGKYAYTPRWASREEFEEIIVSQTTLSDHFPFAIFKELSRTPQGRKVRIIRNS